MSFSISPNLPAAQQLETLQDKLLSYPQKGTHIGGGIHVTMPDTWDGTGKVPPGWSSYKGSSIEHPTNKGTYATPMDDRCTTALATDAKLSAPEKTTLQTAVATAAPLPPDWFPAALEATPG